MIKSISEQISGSTLTKIACIGTGPLGAKADGLHTILTEVLPKINAEAFPGVTVDVPRMLVISADCFSAFMDLNRLRNLNTEALSDSAIAREFLRSELPNGLIGDLRALIENTDQPLAVRSSGVLEGEGKESYAGINLTKMIPNNQETLESRLKSLVEAVKLVWASTFFSDARSSRKAAGYAPDAERMAVIVQDVVGSQHHNRFYPTFSGVARTYNHYPSSGMRPAEGVISLVHGLGKTLVDGDPSWTYSPASPLTPPPFRNTNDILKFTQISSWAINTSRPEAPSPHDDSEFLVRIGHKQAESHGSLKYLASTYDPASDRIRSGISGAGPRVVNFGPLIKSNMLQFNELVAELLRIARQVLKSEVELEFAAELDEKTGSTLRLGLLQIRQLHAAGDRFPVECDDARPDAIVVGSDASLGNGSRCDLQDIVYLRAENFEPAHTRTMAAELEAINRGLIDQGRRSIHIGFGRWGSSDERAGVPVRWAQISSARAIVEAAHPLISADLNFGATFFHRLLNFHVLYLSVGQKRPSRINWEWLDAQPAVWESRHVRHIRLEEPLEVRVDGSTGCGIIRKITS